MGAVASRAKEVAGLARYTEWDRAKADALTNRYRALDMEFGLDMDGLVSLLEDEAAAGEALTLFGRGNGTVNALEVLCAVAMCAQGTEDEVIRSAFLVFDFGGVGSTSYDEFAILVLVVARVLTKVCKAPTEAEPNDQLIDSLIRTMFSPKDRVDLQQATKFADEKFPVDPESKQRTISSLIKPFEIPEPKDEAAALAAMLGGAKEAPLAADAQAEGAAAAAAEAEAAAAAEEEAAAAADAEAAAPAEAEAAAPAEEEAAAPAEEEAAAPAEEEAAAPAEEEAAAPAEEEEAAAPPEEEAAEA
eukprot:g811.t1